MNFKLWLEAQREKMIVYHGTSDKILSSIMSQGLIPDPKKRTWEKDTEISIHTPSRASLSGVYVTDNLLTATSSATTAIDHLGGEHKIIVIMEIEPKTLVADEDSVTSAIGNIVAPGNSHLINDYMIASLYAAWVRLKFNRYEKEHKAQQESKDRKHLQDYEDAYVYGHTEDLIGGPKREKDIAHPALKSRLEDLLRKGFYIALQRKAAYLNSYEFNNTLLSYELEMPYLKNDKRMRPDEAEKHYSRYADQITRTTKRSAQIGDDLFADRYNYTARITTPIRYSGANRIIAVVRLIRSQEHHELVDVVYGQLPETFKQDYKRVVGRLKMKGDYEDEV